MIKLGIDRVSEYLHLFKDKRVGLITNPTGVNSDLQPTIDILYEKTNLVALYSPEHGVRGNIQAGVKLDTYIDEATKLPVYSLYGKTRKPTKEMLEGVDLLAFDIQDVGARFYTYLYTMAYSMMACQEQGKIFVVFDRPNPVNANTVEGNRLNTDYQSFVGYYPLPQRYGLTIGELAMLFNKEFAIGCDLVVIPMEDYKRTMDYADTGLLWVMPSPNIAHMDTPYYYLATCIFEGTNLSEGRGTAKPFHLIGSPYLKPKMVLDRLRSMDLPGVKFRSLYFTPSFSKHAEKLCAGIELLITDKTGFEPVKTGYILLDIIRQTHEEFDYIEPFTKGGKMFIDLLTGDTYLREESLGLEAIFDRFKAEEKAFEVLKRRYHLYD